MRILVSIITNKAVTMSSNKNNSPATSKKALINLGAFSYPAPTWQDITDYVVRNSNINKKVVVRKAR